MIRYFLVVFIFFISCDKNNNPKKYSCLKEDMTFWGNYSNNSSLKLNGCYYYRIVTDTIQYPKSYRIISLYNNGIVYLGSVLIKDNNTLYQQLINDINLNRENDAVWGAYIITNRKIHIQTLADFSDRPFRGCVDVVTETATIVDDSTFNLLDRYGKNSIYYFTELYPKPDSTNLFISILGGP